MNVLAKNRFYRNPGLLPRALRRQTRLVIRSRLEQSSPTPVIRRWKPAGLVGLLATLTLAVAITGQRDHFLSRVILPTHQSSAPEASSEGSQTISAALATGDAPAAVKNGSKTLPINAASAGIVLPVSGQQFYEGDVSPDTAPQERPGQKRNLDLKIVETKTVVVKASKAERVPLDETKTNERLSEAEAKLNEGDDARALAIFEEIRKQDPFNHAALAGEGYLFQHTGQFEDAVATERLLLQHYPDDDKVRQNFVSALNELGTQSAIAELRRIALQRPDLAAAQEALALSLADKKDGDVALRYATRALDLEPLNLVYQLDLAVLDDKLGHRSEAVALYGKVLDGLKDQASDGGALSMGPASIEARRDYLLSVDAPLVQDADASQE